MPLAIPSSAALYTRDAVIAHQWWNCGITSPCMHAGTTLSKNLLHQLQFRGVQCLPIFVHFFDFATQIFLNSMRLVVSNRLAAVHEIIGITRNVLLNINCNSLGNSDINAICFNTYEVSLLSDQSSNTCQQKGGGTVEFFFNMTRRSLAAASHSKSRMERC